MLQPTDHDKAGYNLLNAYLQSNLPSSRGEKIKLNRFVSCSDFANDGRISLQLSKQNNLKSIPEIGMTSNLLTVA